MQTKEKNVQVIEVVNPFVDSVTNEIIRKKKVCAYARVSTDDEDQLNSYDNQINEYTKRINENPEWEFAGIYADRGLTGTSTKKRVQFNQMIKKAFDGKIDLIITKSVSRFARNTVDILSLVQKLREINVEIYFEKDNLYASDPRTDFVLTILSSIAQEESRSTSGNIKWAVQKRYKEGIVLMPTKNFLGFTKNENGELIIEEKEAKIIEEIYDLYLEGHTLKEIADYLMTSNIKSPSGLDKWSSNTVRSILTNEKYYGDAILQKRITINYLTHKLVPNNNIAPKYHVRNNHEGIISKEKWDMVQTLLGYNAKLSCETKYYNKYPLTNLVYCYKCGRAMKRHHINIGRPSKKIVLDCSHASKEKVTCTNKWISNDLVESAVLDSIRELALHYDHLESIISTVEGNLGNDELQQKLEIKNKRLNQLNKEIKELIDLKVKNLDKNDSFNESYTIRVNELNTLKIDIDELKAKINDGNISMLRLNKINEHINDNNYLLNPLIIKNIYKLVLCENDDLIFVIAKGGHASSSILNQKDKIAKINPLIEKTYFSYNLNQNINYKVVFYE